ncbi:hypothetical protein ACFQ7J_11730 [Streptomyces sp. NPDC056501]|uniref:hypothetical protein n=1 Tax=Streptomyces sp. NPDC056501 TaxID=3345841 RepID=UPI003674CC4C
MMRQMRNLCHRLDRGLIREHLRDDRETKSEQGGYAFGPAPPFGEQVAQANAPGRG